jgi:cytochrome c biogenesis protein CcmG/thiol:disulfide interchange protein DsbE
MIKKVSLLLLITLVAITANAQRKKYYILKDEKIIDEAAYQQALTSKMASIMAKQDDYENFKDGINQQFDLVRRNNDSIIFKVTWSNSRGGIEKRKNFNAYKPITENETFTLLKLPTLNNDSIGIENLKGKPTLINFWFTSCAPCIAEMDALNEIKKQFGNKVNFIAITYNTKEIVNDFLKTKQFDFTHIVEAFNEIDFWKISSYPRNVFLDKNGKVVKITESIPSTKNGDVYQFDKSSFVKMLNELL